MRSAGPTETAAKRSGAYRGSDSSLLLSDDEEVGALHTMCASTG